MKEGKGNISEDLLAQAEDRIINGRAISGYPAVDRMTCKEVMVLLDCPNRLHGIRLGVVITSSIIQI